MDAKTTKEERMAEQSKKINSGSSHLQVGHSVVRPSTNALADAAILAFPTA